MQPSRRPRHEISKSAVILYFGLSNAVSLVLAGVVARLVSGRPDGLLTTVVFLSVLGACGWLTIGMSDRILQCVTSGEPAEEET